MPFLFFLLLFSLPVLEIMSIVWVSGVIGLFPVLLLLFASAALGFYLIRSQTFMLGRKLATALRQGVSPEKQLLDSGLLSFAGILLMVPGFTSDILALLLIIPATRRLVWRGFEASARGRFQTWGATQPQPPKPNAGPLKKDDVIDVEFSEVPKDASGDTRRNPGSPWNKLG